MAADEVEAREYHAHFGKKFPAIVFIAPNGKTLDVLEGRIRPDLVRSDHSGNVELFLSDGDEVVDRT